MKDMKTFSDRVGISTTSMRLFVCVTVSAWRAAPCAGGGLRAARRGLQLRLLSLPSGHSLLRFTDFVLLSLELWKSLLISV